MIVKRKMLICNDFLFFVIKHLLKEYVMEISKKYGVKLTPTCVKETLERKEKFKSQQDEDVENVGGGTEDETQTSEPAPMPARDDVYQGPETYPELTDVQPNVRDVRTLKKLAYGRDSELTAVLTYMFQNYVTMNEDLKNALEQVAIIEMRHLALLSNAIVAFGGDPTLTDGMGNVWTGRNVNYTTNPIKFLKNNISSEKEAVEVYMRAARETSNNSLSDLYKRIAEDEEIHSRVFQSYLDKLMV